METVLGFRVDHRLRAVDHRVRHFVAAVGREAVHVEGVLVGDGHAALVADPVLVRGGQREALLRIAEVVQRAPALGVDDVRVLEGGVHVVGELEARARRGGVGHRDLHLLGHQLVARRVGQDDVHPEARHQREQALRHAHRFGVARRVGPAHGQAQAAQVAAAQLLQGHEVGEGLTGVVHVALHVDDRHARVLGHRAHERVPLAGHQVVTDRDAVAVAAQDDAHVLRALAVGHLAGGGVDEVRVRPELRGAGLEAVAGAGGLVEKEEEDGLVRQQTVRLAGLELPLELAGAVDQVLQLAEPPVLGGDVVVSPQVHDPLHVARAAAQANG